MNASQISSATTAELVAFYNANSAADKQVKKFADRKTAERRVAALVASLPAPKARPAPSASRSAAIAATWTDPAVAAKRAVRTHVTCNGVNYRSVLQAFEKLGLPLSKHITFRMSLKAAGTAVFDEKYNFRVVTGEIFVK